LSFYYYFCLSLTALSFSYLFLSASCAFLTTQTLLILTLTAFTFAINTPTFVTEFFTTSTPHMVTTKTLLNPMLAKRALLELLALSKLKEQLVIFIMRVRNLVLFARLSFMKKYSTI